MRYKIKSLFKNSFFYTTIVLVALLLVQVTDIVRAQTYQWTSPIADFPGGQTAPPLDVSDINQTKDGSITFGSGNEKIIVSSSSISIRPGDNIMRKIEKTVHGMQLGAGITNPSYIRINEPTGKISADSANPFIFNTKGLVLPTTSTLQIDNGRASLYFSSTTNSVNVVTANGTSRAFVTSDQIMASAWQPTTIGSGIYYGQGYGLGVAIGSSKIQQGSLLTLDRGAIIENDPAGSSEPLIFAIGGAQLLARNAYYGNSPSGINDEYALAASTTWRFAQKGGATAISFGGGNDEIGGTPLVFHVASTSGSAEHPVQWNTPLSLNPNGNVILSEDKNGGGNVGIGTSTPNARLEINQIENTKPALQINSGWPDGSYNLTLTPFSTSGIVRYSFGTKNNNIQYDNNLVLDRGNVGIGTITPDEKLVVKGNTKISIGDLQFETIDPSNPISPPSVTCPVGSTLYSYWLYSYHTYLNGETRPAFAGSCSASGNIVIKFSQFPDEYYDIIDKIIVYGFVTNTPETIDIDTYLSKLTKFGLVNNNVSSTQLSFSVNTNNSIDYNIHPSEINTSAGGVFVKEVTEPNFQRVMRFLKIGSEGRVAINKDYPQATLDVDGGVRWNGKISMPNMGVGSHQPESSLMVKYDSSSGSEGYYAVYAP